MVGTRSTRRQWCLEVPVRAVRASLLAIPALGEMPSVAAWIGIGVVTVGVLLAMGAVGRRYGARSMAG